MQTMFDGFWIQAYIYDDRDTCKTASICYMCRILPLNTVSLDSDLYACPKYTVIQ